jgi:hypothetical protein
MSLWSRLFKQSAADKAMKEGIRLIWRIVEDEAYQNDMLPPDFSDPIKKGIAVDSLPNATGPFGREPTNPIPVNGAIGELAYLSRLESLEGCNLLFHRLGAINTVDVFEVVTIDGRHWDILYLHCYHPSKTKLAPAGFRIGAPRHFSGFNTSCPQFPYDFDENKTATPDMLRLAYAPRETIRNALRQSSFDRPVSHERKVAAVKGLLTSFMPA